MSKICQRLCDRCSNVILSGGLVLTVVAADKLEMRQRDLDLCSACHDKFEAFLKGGKA